MSKLGVVAFSSTGDPEMGDYDDEPTVIHHDLIDAPGLTAQDQVVCPVRGVEGVLRVHHDAT